MKNVLFAAPAPVFFVGYFFCMVPMNFFQPRRSRGRAGGGRIQPAVSPPPSQKPFPSQETGPRQSPWGVIKAGPCVQRVGWYHTPTPHTPLMEFLFWFRRPGIFRQMTWIIRNPPSPQSMAPEPASRNCAVSGPQPPRFPPSSTSGGLDGKMGCWLCHFVKSLVIYTPKI